MITSTPENKQPPNKRQRRVDHTPFVVLSTNSGKRNQSSEKKVLGNEKRKELFTSDSSNDESNIETEPPIIEVKNDTTVVNEEDYEDEDITSPEPNVSCMEILVGFIKHSGDLILKITHLMYCRGPTANKLLYLFN